MKVPAWGKTLAILGIIFGAFGVIGNSSRLIMPTMAKFQGAMLEEMEKIPVDTIANYEALVDDATGDTIGYDTTYTFQTLGENDAEFNPVRPMKEMFGMDDNSVKLFNLFGYLGIVVAFLFIVGSIFLFFQKPISPTLFITGVSLSLIFRIALVVIFMSQGNIYMMSSSYGSIFVILTDITFLIIAIVSDKNFYKGIDPDEELMEHLRES